ncbi:MAG TPA: SpoIIE family protein phosphatase, partial [Candidatus Cloacimonas sp.]|nr:SpoIIE family protein phosphatase [Candidatus Cloacimonas sp.]
YFHLKNGLYREFSVLSKSEIYDLLPGEKSIALHFSDKHIIIPLQSDVQLDNLFAINESEAIDWMYFASELKNRLPENLFSISLATEGIFKVKTFLFEKGRLTGLFGDERYSVIDYDEASRSLYLSKWIESRAVYYEYNLDSKELRKLPIKAQSLVYARDTAPILHSLNEAYTVEATGLKKRTIKGWTNLFGSYPELDRSFVESTFAWYSSSSPAEISPGSFFYRTHHISRQVDGNIWFWHGDYTQKELKIEKDGDKLDVQIPSLVYNVMSDSISLKPNWLRCLQDRQGRTFIAHEKKGEKRSYIQVSEWIGGKLLEKPADLKIYGRTKLLPYIDDYRRISNNLLSIHCADTLFYFHANGWHSIALEKYQRYGAFNNSTMLEGVLYLCFDNMLVKHVDENTHYLYGFKDGLPENLYGVLSPDERTLLLLTSKGVLSFSEKPFAIKLDLQDGLASGIGRAISLKANQKVSSADNRVRFIVSLLGSIYPEDGSLFYRLKGLSGQWTKVDFRREILFEKLNPGSYSFEVYATDRHGAKTEIQSLSFRILPPWYQSWWAYLAYALTGAGILFGLYKWRTYALKARNKELETKVEQRTQSLIEQQKKIKESIDYASLIQRSVLPQETELAKAWKEHFVVWKPRDVVGGDLYWLQEIPDKAGYLFAVLDCTGHGVPGALLTMTVNSALNHIVLERKISSPPLILELLHQEIGAALHQQVDSNMQDGLEIALIRLGEKPGDLSFAGAGLHLLIYDPRQNELRILRGNRYGLGGTRYQDKLVFQEHNIQPQPGFTLYLYSDGILDQPFPSQDTRRLGSQNWLQIIAGIASEPLSEQKNRIDRMIAEMLMDNEQRDDITIVGLRI